MRENIQEAVEFITENYSGTATIGLILGSGLGEYAESFSDPGIIPYEEIPQSS